jgi:hypothetical protein
LDQLQPSLSPGDPENDRITGGKFETIGTPRLVACVTRDDPGSV